MTPKTPWQDSTPLIEFNDGSSRFVLDDGCYVLLNQGPGGKWIPSAWLFGEALEALKELPPLPSAVS